ncbi:sigma-70 family RNA polymerase sigma factor [Streptomyces sp. NPDC001093]|uniref:RNA polymerase sigma factor n=1 Tax=Streptomyces sp. NPDC001093 TaxID=3154376 RepID=UPI003317FC8F
MDGRQWRGTIVAAQAGDRQALDELVAGRLPLVYNIVGRALNGHADVDDVLQETMLRAVGNLGSLRDPDSFRSWLVAIAMRQVRERARRPSAPMDDALGTDPAVTGMGNPAVGYAVPPAGTQQMWQNEYFHLDGSVTLTQNERGADYGLSVFPTTWAAAEKDITTGPAQGARRYGLVRDTGRDDTPVPQYLTRATPADPATVPQRSRV